MPAAAPAAASLSAQQVASFQAAMPSFPSLFSGRKLQQVILNPGDFLGLPTDASKATPSNADAARLNSALGLTVRNRTPAFTLQDNNKSVSDSPISLHPLVGSIWKVCATTQLAVWPSRASFPTSVVQTGRVQALMDRVRHTRLLRCRASRRRRTLRSSRSRRPRASPTACQTAQRQARRCRTSTSAR